MQLIDDNSWSMDIVLCRRLELEDGTVLDGEEVWNEYKNILEDSDMEYAKSCLQEQVEKLPEHRRFWELYHLAMLCFMKGDFEEGKEVFEHYLQRLKDSFYSGDYYIEWHEQFYNYCIENNQCLLSSKESAQQLVIDMINRRRKSFCEKASYKKMSKELYTL